VRKKKSRGSHGRKKMRRENVLSPARRKEVLACCSTGSMSQEKRGKGLYPRKEVLYT